MTVLDEIAAERRRQIEKGYDAAHDDGDGPALLLEAAVALMITPDGTGPSPNWPFEAASWPSGDLRTRLIQGLALAVACVEAADRQGVPLFGPAA